MPSLNAKHQVTAGWPRPVRKSARALRRGVDVLRLWTSTCRASYEAAALYERLRHFTDAELASRGLNRATLARDVFAASLDRHPCTSTQRQSTSAGGQA